MIPKAEDHTKHKVASLVHGSFMKGGHLLNEKNCSLFFFYLRMGLYEMGSPSIMEVSRVRIIYIFHHETRANK